MKKITRTLSNDMESEEGIDSTMFLTTQNKALVMEMRRYKRQIAESKRELDMLRIKSKEMESLVSIIQRAWSQLNVDMSLLLDSFGDSEVVINDSENIDILKSFLLSGRKYYHINSTDIDRSIPSLQIDEWSSINDITTQRNMCIENIHNKDIIESLFNHIDNNYNIDDQLDNQLLSYTSFTLALLERLCMFIFNSNNSDMNQQVFETLSRIKELNSEKLLLKDIIDKLIHEQSDHMIDKLNNDLTNKPIENEIITSDTSTGSPIKKITNNYDIEQIEKIEILEKQLEESEKNKTKLELLLTDRLARPTIQVENQINDMRKAMEELRKQCKQRVSSLVNECNELKEKSINQELIVNELQSIYSKKIDEIQAVTHSHITQVDKEKNELLLEMTNYKAELAGLTQLKKQVEEYRILDVNNKIELRRLEDKVNSLQTTVPTLQSNLKKSRDNEMFLENSIKALTNDIHSYDDEMNQMIVAQAQSRTKDIQMELDNVNSSMDDLILEIETVSTQERSAREQVSRLLNQVNDSENMQRGILEENLKLNDQIVDAQKKLKESQYKLNVSDHLIKQQNKLITKHIDNEQNNQQQIIELSKINYDLNNNINNKDDEILELKQNYQLLETNLNDNEKFNHDLQLRCDELAKSLENERKLRMEAQKNLKKRSKSSNIFSSVVDNNNDINKSTSVSKNDQMLEITLGMLRCSVCKDRFKEVAITRCFHLFCKECIDENLRNRHRKCPACGEKFGQDDVKTIYFTH